MKDADDDINSSDIEACHRIGKSDRSTANKKTIVHFINRKYCKKKAFLKRKIFATINTVTKYNFSGNNQVAINESLTKTNKSKAFWINPLMLYKGGVVHIKKSQHAKAIKVHHINSLYKQFQQFVFFDDGDDCDLFVDASPNVSDQSSY